jgi:predicted metal-dependent hydrolase
MTQLEVRRPPFQIDETVPFQWQPANPTFGLFGNVFTFLAIAFERYIVPATRQAAERITDAEIATEADAFLKQEAQHARAHYHHAKALIARYPGLGDTFAEVTASYDELLEQKPLEFHLAYIADLEATFTPLFKMIFDHRGPLFDGSDQRVGTLLIWHFVEEIEHRSSALAIHHHVTPNRWYRLRVAPMVFAHVKRMYKLIIAGIEANVPLADSHVPAKAAGPSGLWLAELAVRTPILRRHRRRAGRPPSMLQHVPGRSLLTMVSHLARSQLPSHDPTHEPLPTWVNNWHAAFRAGDDITTYDGARL